MSLASDMLGIYTKADMQKVKEGYRTLWDSYLSLMCTVKVYSDAMLTEIQRCEKGTTTHEELYRIIHNDCSQIKSAVNAAEYVIKAHSESGLFH